MKKEKTIVYICNKDFPKHGLEVGDVFPHYLYTKEAIQKALEKGSIVIDDNF